MKTLVYVIDWGKHYSTLTVWNCLLGRRENLFNIKTKIPDYSGINHHWEFVYEPNFTLKGTINKREPKKLVDKIPKYKNYKWEIVERVKHPENGDTLLLLASTHTDKDWMKCYVLIGEKGVSTLTPEQYANEKFNATLEGNYGKWNRNSLDRDDVPEEIKSVFYDINDNVQFGSGMTKGLVSYIYLDGKFSIDKKPIYLGCSISYDGKGNSGLTEEQKQLIKPFNYIKKYLE